MVRRTRDALLILFALMLIACNGDYNNASGVVSKKNIDAYLHRLEAGIAFNNEAMGDQHKLAEIEDFIVQRRQALYRDEPGRYFLHKGLIELYSSDFLASFVTLNAYVRQTGDCVRPAFHIGMVLETQSIMSGTFILGQAALGTRPSFPLPLSSDQHVSVIAFCKLYPYRQMAPYLSDEILSRRELIVDPRMSIAYYRDFVLDRKDVEALYGIFILEERDIQVLFARESTLDLAELDYVIGFYIHPYHLDYGRASYYADMRDYKAWYTPQAESRIVNLMRAYLGTDQYHEVLAIYNYHLPSFSEVAVSVYHVNLLVSAAYAGLGDLDTALEYLEKDLALSEIYSGELSNARTISDLPQRGDMLYALYELVFVFEEFDAFERAGRYSELEEVVERNVARYKHLRLFNR